MATCTYRTKRSYRNWSAFKTELGNICAREGNGCVRQKCDHQSRATCISDGLCPDPCNMDMSSTFIDGLDSLRIFLESPNSCGRYETTFERCEQENCYASDHTITDGKLFIQRGGLACSTLRDKLLPSDVDFDLECHTCSCACLAPVFCKLNLKQKATTESPPVTPEMTSTAYASTTADNTTVIKRAMGTSENKGGSGAVIGGAIGGVLIVVIVLAILLILYRRRMSSRGNKQPEDHKDRLYVNQPQITPPPDDSYCSLNKDEISDSSNNYNKLHVKYDSSVPPQEKGENQYDYAFEELQSPSGADADLYAEYELAKPIPPGENQIYVNTNPQEFFRAKSDTTSSGNPIPTGSGTLTLNDVTDNGQYLILTADDGTFDEDRACNDNNDDEMYNSLNEGSKTTSNRDKDMYNHLHDVIQDDGDQDTENYDELRVKSRGSEVLDDTYDHCNPRQSREGNNDDNYDHLK